MLSLDACLPASPLMQIEISIFICVASFWALIWIVRRRRLSLGLPVAYLFGLLLIHVPGAVAHLVAGGLIRDTEFTELGIAFTAIASVSFVVGVGLASRAASVRTRPSSAKDDERFRTFCLLGGWLFTYGLSPLGRIPSVGAAIEEGGAIWMLGVMLGLRSALKRGDPASLLLWVTALAVYPVLMLLLGGFLSYGSAAIIIVLAGLTASVRSHGRVVAGIAIVSVIGVNGFLNYFQHRNDIRDAVWGRAPLAERVDVTLDAIREFEWFDPSNEQQLSSLDQRLNQNYFVGLAAARIADGQVDYLYGRSLREGMLALVPRIWWPEKPVFAGSPQIVSEMTGLVLSDTTSFGVGNVMEFQINFGIPGIVLGFIALGAAIAALDRKAALAEDKGDLGSVFLFFLPAVALIRPNGSLVELAAGPAASLVAALGWRWLWNSWVSRSRIPLTRPARALSTRPHRVR